MWTEGLVSAINFIDLFFVIPLFIIGAVASYTDIKYGKIFNSLILLGLVYGIGLISILFLHNVFFVGESENFIYLGKVCLNAVLALATGYFLWHQKFWSAGDAKLFAVYALLLPLKFYDRSYFNYFPSFNLMINLFFPVVIVLGLCSIKDFLIFLFQYLANKKFFSVCPSFKKCCYVIVGGGKNLAVLFINFIFFVIIIQTMLSGLIVVTGREINPHPFLFYLVIISIMKRFNDWKAKSRLLSYLVYIVPLTYLTYLIIQSNFSAIWGLVKMALIFVVLINLTRQFLGRYIDRKEVEIVVLKDLQKGALIFKEDLDKLIGLLGKEDQEAFSWIEAEGIDEKQISILKNKLKKNLDDKVKVYKTFPFAPYMFLSALISMFTRSSFLALLGALLKF